MGELKKTVRNKSYSFYQKIKRFTLLLYYKFLRIQATPETISRGLASGVFVGMLPVLPVQTPCAILLAVACKGNKIAAALGTWVSNPLNWVPLYLTFYYLGKKVLHFIFKLQGKTVLPFTTPRLDLDHISFMELLEKGPEMLFIMFVGALILAIPSAFISYYISLKSIKLYQQRKKIRLQKRIQKLEREAIEKKIKEQQQALNKENNTQTTEIKRKYSIFSLKKGQKSETNNDDSSNKILETKRKLSFFKFKKEKNKALSCKKKNTKPKEIRKILQIFNFKSKEEKI